MEGYSMMMSEAEWREFWNEYELWLDVIELSLSLPLPEGEEYDLESSR